MIYEGNARTYTNILSSEQVYESLEQIYYEILFSRKLVWKNFKKW